jgi:hypothetical protein
MGCAGASNSFWVKNPHPSEEPATPTRRSKKAGPWAASLARTMGTSANMYICWVAYLLHPSTLLGAPSF